MEGSLLFIEQVWLASSARMRMHTLDHVFTDPQMAQMDLA
jgi:hypothetical protein